MDNPTKAIVVKQEVFDGLDIIRDSGVINMFDRKGVIKLLYAIGADAVARWVEENEHEYANGIFNGFKPNKVA